MVLGKWFLSIARGPVEAGAGDAGQEGSEVSGAVWISSVKGNYALGDKPGVRTKFHGHVWEPAEFELPPTPDDIYANIRRAGRGFALRREELPEAAAVWNEKRFKLLGDVFYAGGFLVVRGKLADILSRFDLGEGGLIPFPVYQADLLTPYPGEFFLLNFGAIKSTIRPEQSQNVVKFAVDRSTGKQIWKVNGWHDNDEVALSTSALEGPDIWVEELVDNKIFLSDNLAQPLMNIGLSDVFKLKRCRLVGDAA